MCFYMHQKNGYDKKKNSGVIATHIENTKDLTSTLKKKNSKFLRSIKKKDGTPRISRTFKVRVDPLVESLSKGERLRAMDAAPGGASKSCSSAAQKCPEDECDVPKHTVYVLQTRIW